MGQNRHFGKPEVKIFVKNRQFFNGVKPNEPRKPLLIFCKQCLTILIPYNEKLRATCVELQRLKIKKIEKFGIFRGKIAQICPKVHDFSIGMKNVRRKVLIICQFMAACKISGKSLEPFLSIKKFRQLFLYGKSSLITNAGRTGPSPKAGENFKNQKHGPPRIGLGRTKLFAALESKGLLPQAYGLSHVARQDWDNVIRTQPILN